MPKYVIEREIPGAGNLTPQELQSISQKSCSVLQNLGPQIQWVESYVTGDKVYCIYIAPSEDMIRAHAQQGGFPANRISEIKTIIVRRRRKVTVQPPRPRAKRKSLRRRICLSLISLLNMESAHSKLEV